MSSCNHVGTQMEPCHICAKDDELSSLRGSCKALGAENKQLKRSAKKAAREFDTMAQRLQEAERLNNRMASLLQGIRRHNSSGLTRDTQDEIDAVLAGKGDKS